eukprot:Nk52_evm29s370 gene=Nk52_evmTU29s370
MVVQFDALFDTRVNGSETAVNKKGGNSISLGKDPSLVNESDGVDLIAEDISAGKKSKKKRKKKKSKAGLNSASSDSSVNTLRELIESGPKNNFERKRSSVKFDVQGINIVYFERSDIIDPGAFSSRASRNKSKRQTRLCVSDSEVSDYKNPNGEKIDSFENSTVGVEKGKKSILKLPKNWDCTKHICKSTNCNNSLEKRRRKSESVLSVEEPDFGPVLKGAKKFEKEVVDSALMSSPSSISASDNDEPSPSPDSIRQKSDRQVKNRKKQKKGKKSKALTVEKKGRAQNEAQNQNEGGDADCEGNGVQEVIVTCVEVKHVMHLWNDRGEDVEVKVLEEIGEDNLQVSFDNDGALIQFCKGGDEVLYRWRIDTFDSVNVADSCYEYRAKEKSLVLKFCKTNKTKRWKMLEALGRRKKGDIPKIAVTDTVDYCVGKENIENEGSASVAVDGKIKKNSSMDSLENEVSNKTQPVDTKNEVKETNVSEPPAKETADVLEIVSQVKRLNVNEDYFKGAVGLENYSNSCFMNSVLQCLRYTSCLFDYFESGEFRGHVNRDNPLGMKGELADCFGSLMKRMGSVEKKVLSADKLLRVIGRYNEQFMGDWQHDCQEFLAFLLDGLHEDVNVVKKKPYIEQEDYLIKDGESNSKDPVMGKKRWEDHLKRNDSFIVSKFQGQFRSSVKCSNCNVTSVTFDPFMFLSLPVPELKRKIEFDLIIRVIEYDSSENTFAASLVNLGKISTIATTEEIKDDILRFTNRAEEENVQNRSVEILLMKKNEIAKQMKSPTEKIGRLLMNRSFECFAFVHSASVSAPVLFRFQEVVELKNCSKCGKSENTLLKRCLKCKSVCYCSKECQREHWREHKLRCIPKKRKMCLSPILMFFPFAETTVEELYKYTFKYLSGFFGGVNYDASTLSSCLSVFELRNVDRHGDVVHHWLNDIKASCRENVPSQKVNLSKLNFLSVDWSTKAFETICDVGVASSVLKGEVEEYVLERKEEETEEVVSNPTLNTCLDLFTKEERIKDKDAWYCPQCKTHRSATKSLLLWTVPEYLIIHLKRFKFIAPAEQIEENVHQSHHPFSKLFSSMQMRREKLNTKIELPYESYLDISGYVKGMEANHYKLYAVASHAGISQGGHYTATTYCKGEWLLFDDETVSKVTNLEREFNSLTRHPYLLFFRKVY